MAQAYTRAFMSAKINAPADAVWEIMGGFNNLPAIMGSIISKSELDRPGVVRTLTLKDGGGKLLERLLKYDATTRTQMYAIIGTRRCKVPWKDYVATLKVKDNKPGRSSIVEWSSRFYPAGVTPDEARQAALGIYGTGIEGTKRKLGRKKPGPRRAKTGARARSKKK